MKKNSGQKSRATVPLRHQSTNKPGNISVTVGEKLNSHKIINQPINQS
jgi:hypothetical protein